MIVPMNSDGARIETLLTGSITLSILLPEGQSDGLVTWIFRPSSRITS
jgi:hypothetical protein